MEGRATVSATQVEQAAGDDQVSVLVVDQDGEFGGVFRFGVYTGGDWYADGVHAHRKPDGQWVNLGEGGSRGEGWTTPWRPPGGGWTGDHLFVVGTAGLDVEVDGDDAELTVVYGFAAPEVRTLAVAGPRRSRSVPITSPVSAFAVVLVGRGDFSVTPVTADGPVGRQRMFKLGPVA